MLALPDKRMNHRTAQVLGGVCAPAGLLPTAPEELLVVKRLEDAVGSSIVFTMSESILLIPTENTTWEASVFKKQDYVDGWRRGGGEGGYGEGGMIRESVFH